MKIALSIPTVSELAELYRNALGNKDQPLALVAEAAAFQVAAAEAALAEAAVLAEFAGFGRRSP